MLEKRVKVAEKTSGVAIASMVLGIFSIFFGYIPIFGRAIIAVGLTLAIKSLKNIRKNKNISGIGFAKTGIILNSIGLILAVIVCSVIVIFLLDINNKEVIYIEKLSASEPLANEYVNDYMGISLSYPGSVEAKPIGTAHISLSENVEFISSNKTACFQIELFYKRFNKDNHSEDSLDGLDAVEHVESFLIIKSVNALPAPIPYKIEDIQTIMINGNEYYTYSFKHISQRNIQRDTLIYPRGQFYYKFTFLNQNKDFIMKIMDSVKFINSTNLDLSKTI